MLVRARALAALAQSPAHCPRSSLPAAREQFRLPSVGELMHALEGTAGSGDGGGGFKPTRWFLLCCYEATHGEGSALSKVRPGKLSREVSERAMVALFYKLSGCNQLLPVWRHAASDARALYSEATNLHRLIGQDKLPSNTNLRAWWLANPTALEPKEFHYHLPLNYIRSPVFDAAAEKRATWRRHVGVLGARHGQQRAFDSSAERRPLSAAALATLHLYGERGAQT
jgi:hypothetical protein